jgi:hypothetical protein
MKKFITNLFFFSIPMVLFLLFTVVFYLIELQKVELKINFIAKYDIILMGDSQMQRINPKLFHNKTYNFASSGEHYYFTYNKIKKLINAKNHKVKQIILGVSAHSFAPVYNRLIDSKYIEGQSSFSRYLYFLNVNNDDFINTSDLFDKNSVKAIFDGPDWGGYYQSEFKNPNTSTINSIFTIHYSKQSNENVLAQKQAYYLAQIDSICHKHKIKLTLVSLPYHHLYQSKINILYSNKLNMVVNDLKNHHYISYLNYKINPELMSDGVHLNKKGAEQFTKSISKAMDCSDATPPIH